MRKTTLWCFIIIFLAGNIIGMHIGYIPIVIQSYTDGTNCNSSSKDDCLWSGSQICMWNPMNDTCEFSAFTLYGVRCETLDRDQCEAQKHWCQWTQTSFGNHHSCQYQQGWSKTNTALVGTMSVIGGLVGSFASNFFIKKTGVNNTICFAGILAVISCVFLITGWRAYDDGMRLGLMLTGRFFAGLFLGLASTSATMYVVDVAPRERTRVLGVGFQVFITFGIVTAALC